MEDKTLTYGLSGFFFFFSRTVFSIRNVSEGGAERTSVQLDAEIPHNTHFSLFDLFQTDFTTVVSPPRGDFFYLSSQQASILEVQNWLYPST